MITAYCLLLCNAAAYNIYCIYKMVKAEFDRKFKFSLQFFTIFLNIGAPIIWTIWLLFNYKGFYPDVIYGGIIGDELLTTLAQIFSMSALLSIILVWFNIVDSTKTMTKITSDTDKKTSKYINAYIITLFIILFPCAIIGSVYKNILKTISMGIIALTVFILISGGIKYSYKLSKILNSGNIDETRKKAISNIRLITIISSITGLIIVLMLIIKMIFIEGPHQTLWLYHFIIHICVNIIIFIIANNVSYKARTKNISSLVSRRQTTVVSVSKHQ